MRPLNTGWRIFADDLPARLTESEPDTAFHLPGADALADIIGIGYYLKKHRAKYAVQA